jgi:hypothetical protein
MDISQWLDAFNNYWLTYNIDFVMDLFTDDVEYWETPFYKLESKEHLKQEWQAILSQKDIKHQTSIFSSTADNKHAIIWNLSYLKNGILYESAGTYLIGLNNKGLCNFFYYTGAPKPN